MNTIRRPTTAPRAGFTLVEIIIVTAIVAILAGIVYVSYRGSQDRAKVSEIQANLRNLGQTVTTRMAAGEVGGTMYAKALREAGQYELTREMSGAGTARKYFAFCDIPGGRFAIASRPVLNGRVYTYVNDKVTDVAFNATGATAIQQICYSADATYTTAYASEAITE